MRGSTAARTIMRTASNQRSPSRTVFSSSTAGDGDDADTTAPRFGGESQRGRRPNFIRRHPLQQSGNDGSGTAAQMRGRDGDAAIAVEWTDRNAEPRIAA